MEDFKPHFTFQIVITRANLLDIVNTKKLVVWSVATFLMLAVLTYTAASSAHFVFIPLLAGVGLGACKVEQLHRRRKDINRLFAGHEVMLADVTTIKEEGTGKLMVNILSEFRVSWNSDTDFIPSGNAIKLLKHKVDPKF